MTGMEVASAEWRANGKSKSRSLHYAPTKFVGAPVGMTDLGKKNYSESTGVGTMYRAPTRAKAEKNLKYRRRLGA